MNAKTDFPLDPVAAARELMEIATKANAAAQATLERAAAAEPQIGRAHV